MTRLARDAPTLIPPVVFPIASLRPIQRVLVGLIEDARVEALAIERFPGLRALWLPWHVATPNGAAIALDLLARLACALLDPACEDPNGFVMRARRRRQPSRPGHQSRHAAAKIASQPTARNSFWC